jgi:hypothetical protein
VEVTNRSLVPRFHALEEPEKFKFSLTSAAKVAPDFHLYGRNEMTLPERGTRTGGAFTH